jgi:hypothetical protein
MIQLTQGFKLFQPWATDVVKGKINFLIRAMPVKKRGRVAVIATKWIDRIWLENISNQELINFKNKIGGIGSVEIKDCIEINLDEVRNRLIHLAGKKYWDYYPKHLIPNFTRTGKLYIWKFDEAKEWKEEKQVKGGGITWVKINLKE